MKTYILLDRSGSMASRWEETINALNGYVKELAENKDTKKTKVSVYTFDGMGGLEFNTLRENVKATEWNEIALHEDSPRGMTPLLDAIGQLNSIVNKASPKKAAVVIMTDGCENGSKEVKKEAAKKMLDGFKDKGYDLTFIGADFDAFGEAGGLGLSAGVTLNTSAGNYAGAMKGLAAKTAFYSSTGQTRAFYDSERAEAAGES